MQVKRRTYSKHPFSEAAFEALLADGSLEGNGTSDVSSISGSDDDETSRESGREAKQSSLKLWLALESSGLRLAVWQVLTTDELNDGSHESLFSSLKSMVKNHAPWVVLLCAGGHFAGVVVDSHGGSVLAHQTFHRYVVRAKAGGRQSSRDATGRAPKSAGASLRRYNESALEKETKELLASWKPYLESAALIFVYAPAVNSKLLFAGDPPPIRRDDSRVRRIPMSVRRPTFKEAIRVLMTLGSIEYDDGPEEIDGLVTKGHVEGNGVPRAGVDKLRAAEVEELASSREGESVAEAGEVETLVTTDDLHSPMDGSNSGDGMKAEQTGVRTDLHHASLAGDVQRVSALLETGADPTLRDERGRTPYALASDKETRNAFRRYMAEAGDCWNWQAAGVPSALTPELEAIQASKKAEKDAKRRAREKERRAEKRAHEKLRAAQREDIEAKGLPESSTGGNKSRGSASSSSSQTQVETAAQKLAEERERRAAAAEVRMKLASQNLVENSSSKFPLPITVGNTSTNPLPGGVTAPVTESGIPKGAPCCDCCGISLGRMTPFYRLNYRYCSTTCVHVHRLSLAGNGK